MKKIETIVNSCSDCRYHLVYKWEKSNCDFLDVCYFNHPDCEDIAFILAARGNRDVSHIEIPENCPLETYKD
jgi:hypothetical protein